MNKFWKIAEEQMNKSYRSVIADSYIDELVSRVKQKMDEQGKSIVDDSSPNDHKVTGPEKATGETLVETEETDDKDGEGNAPDEADQGDKNNDDAGEGERETDGGIEDNSEEDDSTDDEKSEDGDNEDGETDDEDYVEIADDEDGSNNSDSTEDDDDGYDYDLDGDDATSDDENNSDESIDGEPEEDRLNQQEQDGDEKDHLLDSVSNLGEEVDEIKQDGKVSNDEIVPLIKSILETVTLLLHSQPPATKTAAKGVQMRRKDKDAMADTGGFTKRRLHPKDKPSREEHKDRFHKKRMNSDDFDPDLDSDK